MALRCLIFTSNEETIQPIWPVLAELGIQGEYCASAVDATEKVTTAMFQMVITDWNDQPEAAFLLKAARDLKAAQRPLTLAIIGDDSKLPEALQAGANSVLVSPIREKQVRDTLGTACQLLLAKQRQAAAPSLAAASATPRDAAMAAAASAGAGSAARSVPFAVTQAPEKSFRAGEFLRSPELSAQFDTETEPEVQKSLDQAAAAEMDAVTELEPMAASMQDAPAEPPTASKVAGWNALQSRITRNAPPQAAATLEAPPKSELLSYGDTTSYAEVGAASAAAAAPATELQVPAGNEPQTEARVETPPDPTPEEQDESIYPPGIHPPGIHPPEQPRSKRGVKILGAILAVCLVLVAVPQTRQKLLHAGGNWLNPPPAALPQAEPLHDSFGQSADEYKLPATGNIREGTTDPSQIQVVPVVDPTAKPDNTADASGQTPDSQPKDATASIPSTGNAAGDATVSAALPVSSISPGSSSGTSPAAAPAQPSVPVTQTAVTQAPVPQIRPAALPAQTTVSLSSLHTASTGSGSGIPSSLRSQLASSTPEAGGAMPPEAAMSSIEPVKLPEATVRDLLTEQPIDPEYPASAKASGQKGSVVLQVTIGRDGAVQDAKFLQGSLVFARAAIDAVKQWHFKPYAMNGRAVSIQCPITLSFKPPV